MKMSIEKADKTLLEFYHYIKGDVHFCGYNEDNVLNTIDFVRNIMRKYQKIQEIIAMDDENHRRTIRLADLKEVIEDGNVDC